MNMKIVLILFFLFGLSQAKIFTSCALAKELLASGIPLADLGNWICLVEAESSKNSSSKGGPNSDNSYDHGLFQINDRYWCESDTPGGDCNIKCEDLRNDDIADDVKCALKMKKKHGYYAWYGWVNKCRDKPLPSLNNCFN